MTKLALKTQVSGYTVQTPGAVHAVKLQGGRSRYRRDVLNNAHMVNVAWNLTQEQFEYFQAFFFTEIEDGSLPFTVDLFIDDGELTTYTANFVPDSKQEEYLGGYLWRISAQLEVEAIARDSTADAALVAAYNSANP